MEPALQLLLIVLNHPASVQETLKRAEQLRIELEAQLTKRQVEAAQARGRKQSFDQVVSEILDQFS